MTCILHIDHLGVVDFLQPKDSLRMADILWMEAGVVMPVFVMQDDTPEMV